MNDLLSSSIASCDSSTSLKALDLVSSSFRSEKSAFSPQDIPLAPAKEGLSTAVSARAQKTLEEASQSAAEAKKAGIDLLKGSAFSQLKSCAFAGIGLGVAVAATALSGGAGLSILIAAGVAFSLAVADAGCAMANYLQAKNGGEGLAMGSDAIANAVYGLLNRMGLDNPHAEDWSDKVSITARSLLSIGTLCSGFSADPTLSSKVIGTLSSIGTIKDFAEPLVDFVMEAFPQGSSSKVSELSELQQQKNLAASRMALTAYKMHTAELLEQKDQQVNTLTAQLSEAKSEVSTTHFQSTIKASINSKLKVSNHALQVQLASKDQQLLEMKMQLEQLQQLLMQSPQDLAAFNTAKLAT